MVEGGDYENPWLYEGKPFTSDDINDFFGYVYRITNKTTGKKYIRQKIFRTETKTQRRKNEKLLANRIGRSIMDRPPNSKPTYPSLENPIFPERSCLSIQLWGKPTMKRPDNCLLTTF